MIYWNTYKRNNFIRRKLGEHQRSVDPALSPSRGSSVTWGIDHGRGNYWLFNTNERLNEIGSTGLSHKSVLIRL